MDVDGVEWTDGMERVVLAEVAERVGRRKSRNRRRDG